MGDREVEDVSVTRAPLPELDAVLVGLVILEHPAAATVAGDRFESPRWQHVARVLLRHRGAGRRLGEMVAAGDVLGIAGIDFAKTLAAEAVLATLEAARLDM